MKAQLLAVVLATCTCVDWVRIAGTVKAVNLKAQAVVVENKDGDLFTIPVDFQVKLTDKGGEPKFLKDLQLNEKVILTKTVADLPKDDTEGMAQPEPTQRGR
jgi:hypothetical protein